MWTLLGSLNLWALFQVTNLILHHLLAVFSVLLPPLFLFVFFSPKSTFHSCKRISGSTTGKSQTMTVCAESWRHDHLVVGILVAAKPTKDLGFILPRSLKVSGKNRKVLSIFLVLKSHELILWLYYTAICNDRGIFMDSWKCPVQRTCVICAVYRMGSQWISRDS